MSEMEFIPASGAVDYKYDAATKSVSFISGASLAPGEKIVYKLFAKQLKKALLRILQNFVMTSLTNLFTMKKVLISTSRSITNNQHNQSRCYLEI